MSEDRVPYGAREVRMSGDVRMCCSSDINLLPVAARYRTLRELGAAGVVSAVCVCSACCLMVLADGIGPTGWMLEGNMAHRPGTDGFPMLQARPLIEQARQVLNGVAATAGETLTRGAVLRDRRRRG